MSNNNLLVLTENKTGRDFVVGDIHGAFDLLDKALLAVSFDPAKDRLIAVGDLINGGPQSADCLRYLGQPWFYSIRGNHEEFFMRIYKDDKLDFSMFKRDVRETSFAWILNASPETLNNIREHFKKLPVALEIQTSEGPIGFVHADVPPGMDWPAFKQKLLAQDPATLHAAVWERTRIESSDASGVAGASRIFHGHTPIEGAPKALGNCFYVDTGAVYKLSFKSERDYFLTLSDIKANAADICNPQPTKEKLVRTATVKKPPSPAG